MGPLRGLRLFPSIVGTMKMAKMIQHMQLGDDEVVATDVAWSRYTRKDLIKNYLEGDTRKVLLSATESNKENLQDCGAILSEFKVPWWGIIYPASAKFYGPAEL